MKRNGLGLLLTALLTLFVFSGCETLKQLDQAGDEASKGPYQPIYVLSFHEVIKYPRGLSNLERQAQSFDGRKVWYNANQFLSSEHIDEVKLVPVPNKPERFKVLVHVNRRGKLNWQMAASNNNEMIVLLDGMLIDDFRPVKPTGPDQEWFELNTEFDSVVATGIEQYAKKNYESYNPGASDWGW